MHRAVVALGRLAAVALLAGCPKTVTPEPAGWDVVPRLPSPDAGAYTRSAEPPADPALRPLVKGLTWDASLSGAAAGLALELVNEPVGSVALTRWRVRDARWRAGYPFPVTDARAWTAMPDGGPPEALVSWLAAHPPTADLGLVRARGHDADLWVALRARPMPGWTGRVPRQVPEGAVLELPAVPGARYRVADANGAMLEGALDSPASLEASTLGEWLVEILPAEGPSALFPVYVGIVPPTLALIEEVEGVRDDGDALDRTVQLLASIREAYGTSPLQRDFFLDAGARSLLRGDSEDADGVRASLSLPEGRTAIWQCRETSVESCLDRVLWTPAHRSALLDDASVLGLAATVEASGVHLVGIVGPTD